jgi:predicted unusual protein kinase regulating ubiquinone biosynthesis (AarF/ABC1/UbiB family)
MAEPGGGRNAPVPQGRTRRFLHLGRAVGEMAAGAAAEGLTRLARGERPVLAELMLSPANAQRLAGRLSQMRGAVMKVGQLMSMDGHGVLPAPFAELLGTLRDQAHSMPATQLAEVLEREYGADWHHRFRRFSYTPIAAASIGQVHRAETHDGQLLALKIQYPGVKASIDSDVANLTLLARTPGLVPGAVDTSAMLARVREQLHLETDYIAEARNATEYRRRLGDDPVLTVPAVHEEHSTAHIIATDFAPGVPVDQLTRPGVPQAQRDHVAAALSRLSIHEFFRMRLVQTDPNFGNYLYDAASGRVALIDFGATEAVADSRVEHLRELGRALRDADLERLTAAALAAGFVGAQDPPAQTRGVIAMMLTAGEPLQQRGPYDFGASDLFARTFQQGRAQFFGEGYARTPPPDLLFLQRKFIGSFMLCTRLRARLDLNEVFGTEL